MSTLEPHVSQNTGVSVKPESVQAPHQSKAYQLKRDVVF